MRRMLTVTLAALVFTSAVPAARATIWTGVNSGTTETITALDYRADKTVFGTANGNIFTLAGGLRKSFPGLAVIDLKLNPSGTTGVAVLSGGKVVAVHGRREHVGRGDTAADLQEHRARLQRRTAVAVSAHAGPDRGRLVERHDRVHLEQPARVAAEDHQRRRQLE